MYGFVKALGFSYGSYDDQFYMGCMAWIVLLLAVIAVFVAVGAIGNWRRR